MGSDYNHHLLLHDTLKKLSVEKSTKKKAHTTINKYIVLTLLLTNTLSIITASFTTYILTSELQKAKPIPGPGVRVTADHKRGVGLLLDQGLTQDLQNTHEGGAQDIQNKPSSLCHGPNTQRAVVHIEVSTDRNTTDKNDQDLADWWQEK